MGGNQNGSFEKRVLSIRDERKNDFASRSSSG